MSHSDDDRESGEGGGRSRIDECDSEPEVVELSHEDRHIKRDYEKIRESIEIWIDSACNDGIINFGHISRAAGGKNRGAQQLRDLCVDPLDEDPLDVKLDVVKSVVKKDRKDIHFFILSLVFRKHIFREILAQHYPLGVTNEQQFTLCTVQDEMTRMKNATSKVYQWKLETLTALCASTSFKEQQASRVSELWTGLLEELSYWLKLDDRWSHHAPELLKTIFDPAARLHQHIRCSDQRYELSYDTKNASGQACILKDLSSWRTITGADERVFHRLFPGLRKLAVRKGEKDVQLVQPVMVVYRPGQGVSSSRSLRGHSKRAVKGPQRNESPEYEDASNSPSGQGFLDWLTRGRQWNHREH